MSPRLRWSDTGNTFKMAKNRKKTPYASAFKSGTKRAREKRFAGNGRPRACLQKFTTDFWISSPAFSNGSSKLVDILTPFFRTQRVISPSPDWNSKFCSKVLFPWTWRSCVPSFMKLGLMVTKLKRGKGVRNESGETRVLVFPRNAVFTQVAMFGAHFGQLSLRIFSSGFRQKILCGFYFPTVKKNRKWPKTQIKGGVLP